MNVKFSKKKIAYVPWIALAAFVIVIVGMSVWAAGASKALNASQSALAQVNVKVDDYLSTIHNAGVGAVVCVTLMSILITLMSGARTCLEKAVDEKGRAVCGTWLWLAVEAVICTVVWIILFWLVFVVFGGCLWYASVYGAVNVMQVSAKAGKDSGIIMNGSLPMGTGANQTSCPTQCLNLAYFNWASTQASSCFCDTNAINAALNFSNKAYDALGSVVAGAFVMWVGASFMLMSAVGDFSRTRRERELLLRAQKQAAEMAAQSMAMGTAPAYMHYATAQDTLPLLKVQQMQQQQMQQQQQQQMQAAMQQQMQAQMAQMPPPVSITMGHKGSQPGMGHHV